MVYCYPPHLSIHCLPCRQVSQCIAQQYLHCSKIDQPILQRQPNFGGQNSKHRYQVTKNLASVNMLAMTLGMPKLKMMVAYAWNITLAWLLVFLSHPFLWPQICSHPETKPYNQFLRGLLHMTSIPGYYIRRRITMQKVSIKFPFFFIFKPTTAKKGMNKHFQAKCAKLFKL